jgi:RNA 2',3'-cyclic 3'-phosphodiesterase
MRLFIAVPVAPSPAFSTATQSLRALAPGARIVPGGSWHLTLRFLGELDNPLAAVAAMHEALLGVAAITAEVRGVGAFPEPRAARVAWAAVAAPGLGHVAERIREATANLGEPPGHDRFVPHVTLARLQRPSDLTSWIDCYRDTLFFSGVFDRVALFSSKLTSKGPVYTAESVAKLA